MKLEPMPAPWWTITRRRAAILQGAAAVFWTGLWWFTDLGFAPAAFVWGCCWTTVTWCFGGEKL